jgi:hypothetical protein
VYLLGVTLENGTDDTQAAGTKGEYRRSLRAKHLAAPGEVLAEVWQHDDRAHYSTYSRTAAPMYMAEVRDRLS